MQNIKLSVLVIFLIFFMQTFAHAQEADIMVYHATGKATSAITGKALKKGSLLTIKDNIVLAENSSVVLICKDFNVIKISKKGINQVRELLNQCKGTQASFSATYFKYVWNEFTHKHGTPDQDPLNYMKNVGAVSRGIDIVEAGTSLDTLHFAAGLLPIKLAQLPKQFFVAVYNDEYDGGLELRKNFTDSNLWLNTVLQELPPGEYYWQIADSVQSYSARKYVKVWDKAAYKEAVETLLQNVPQTLQAETAFMEGYILAENYFLAEAHTYFKLAISLEPNNLVYKKAYEKIYF